MIVVESLGLLFTHVPQTGGTAIRRYLCDEFDGVEAGAYHGHDDRHLDEAWRGREFRRVATIRNPLDVTVSSYFKQRTDHEGWYLSGSLGERRVAQTTYAQRADIDFDDWFLRYRTRVFAPSWLHAARRADILLRFETLGDDLHAMLDRLGVTDAPALPISNATDRPTGVDEFYRSEPARERARRVFSPFMREFGYAFPADWNGGTPMLSRVEYAIGQRARRLLLAPGD